MNMNDKNSLSRRKLALSGVQLGFSVLFCISYTCYCIQPEPWCRTMLITSRFHFPKTITSVIFLDTVRSKTDLHELS